MKSVALHIAIQQALAQKFTSDTIKAPLTREIKRPARGRGNQGDWVNNRKAVGELPEHKDWNDKVRQKKLKKLAKRAMTKIKKRKEKK